MEPPVSLPMAYQTSPAATAAAAPPEEPPGTRRRFQGFRGGPGKEVYEVEPQADTALFSVALDTPPAAGSFSTTVAS